MNILQVSTADLGGGAERVAWNLLEFYRSRGHAAWMAVGYKKSAHPAVFELPNHNRWIRRIRRMPDLVRGIESFSFPGTSRVLQMTPEPPEILHCHNLHGNYFDLRLLPSISAQIPVLLTVHDAWLTTGHCAHSLGCDRWLNGCGHCPDLTIYPRVWRDRTDANWQRKRQIYANTRLWIAAPSQWLLERIRRSMLSVAALDTRVIPNGVDLTIFKPSNRLAAREKLQLPADADIVCFSGMRKKGDAWRDYETIARALQQLTSTQRDRRLVCVALGAESAGHKFGTADVRHFPLTRDPAEVANFYRAADVYVHASLADTFPNTIIEAQACGTPVISTSTGGIPEQIESGVSGFLVPLGDSHAMATAVDQLLNSRALLKAMSAQAAERARRLYGLVKQAQSYLDWYGEIVHDFASGSYCRPETQSTGSIH